MLSLKSKPYSFMKTIFFRCRMYIFGAVFLIVFSFSCSNQVVEEDYMIGDSPHINLQDKQSDRAFTCHSFTVGSSFLGISTTIHYCCLGETLCGAPIETGCICGFVSDSTYEEIMGIGRTDYFENKIHISEFIADKSLQSITITDSSEIDISNMNYMVKCKTYLVDKNGYISLELVAKKN